MVLANAKKNYQEEKKEPKYLGVQITNTIGKGLGGCMGYSF